MFLFLLDTFLLFSSGRLIDVLSTNSSYVYLFFGQLIYTQPLVSFLVGCLFSLTVGISARADLTSPQILPPGFGVEKLPLLSLSNLPGPAGGHQFERLPRIPAQASCEVMVLVQLA
jgi:hypothetical protein